METAVLERSVYQEAWPKTVKPEKKKNFEEACVECNAVPLEIFIDELKKRVKERYQAAKRLVYTKKSYLCCYNFKREYGNTLPGVVYK